jgi:hypothetical protein
MADHDERGLVTAEYSVGTIGAVLIAAVLYKLGMLDHDNPWLDNLHDILEARSLRPHAAIRHQDPMRREHGMVSAELATIAPFGVAFAFLLLWIVSLGLTQVRIADASREAARVVARGEPVSAAEDVARRQSPPGAQVFVRSKGGLVTVTVKARSRMPVPFFSGVGSRSMESSSVAAQESP